jgi:TolA-binding protein
MVINVRIALFAALVMLSAVPLMAKDYIYAPRDARQDEVAGSPEGLLVREVEVHKGDTLTRISKRFSGRGAYYSQILLFNAIKNPDLIYPGNILRVPVSKSKLSAAAVKVKKPLKAVEPAVAAPVQPVVTPKPVVEQPAVVKSTVFEPKVVAEEQSLFANGVAAFKKSDCNGAIQFFERLEAGYPSSTLLPDANLYKAECYMKLSGQ